MGWLGSDGLCVDEGTEVPGRNGSLGVVTGAPHPVSPQRFADSREGSTPGSSPPSPGRPAPPVCRAGQGSPAAAQTSQAIGSFGLTPS